MKVKSTQDGILFQDLFKEKEMNLTLEITDREKDTLQAYFEGRKLYPGDIKSIIHLLVWGELQEATSEL